MDVLQSIAVEIGADLGPLQAGMNQSARIGMAGGEATGSAYALGFRSRALNMIGALSDLKSGVMEIGRSAYSFSGLEIAAQYQSIKAGLTGVIGDAKEADRVFNDLDKLGGTTAFDTAGLIGLSRGLIGVGVDTRSVTGDIRAMADAVATVNGGNDGLMRLSENLGQIRSTPTHPELTDLKQLTRMGLNIDKIVGSALGKELENGGGVRALQSMTGQQAYDTLITGFSKTYGGNAQKMADSTLLGVGQNAMEAVGKIMLPTGEALIPAFTAASGAIRDTGEKMKAFNEATGGSAGLLVTVGIGAIVVRKLKGDFDSAVGSVVRLTTAIDRLAISADGAASKGIGNAPPVAGGKGASTVATVGSIAAYALAIDTGLQAAPGAIGGIAGSLKKQNNVYSQAAGEYMESVSDSIGAPQKWIGKWIGDNPWSHGIGSIAGYAIGSSKGVNAAAERLYKGAEDVTTKDAVANAQEEATRATKELTQAMDKTRFSLMGGGTRAGAEAGALEAEYAMIRMSRAGGLA